MAQRRFRDEWPNGLPFSCRERAGETCRKPNDLAREAVGCNGGLGELAHPLTIGPQWHRTPPRNHVRLQYSQRWFQIDAETRSASIRLRDWRDHVYREIPHRLVELYNP